MNRKAVAGMMCALLVSGLLGSAALADERIKEGTVVGIDKDFMLFVVRGAEGDQWTVSWATGTKPRGNLEASQLSLFERVRFDYTERGGVNRLTELERNDSR